jgi:hypothetical protein
MGGGMALNYHIDPDPALKCYAARNVKKISGWFCEGKNTPHHILEDSNAQVGGSSFTSRFRSLNDDVTVVVFLYKEKISERREKIPDRDM